MVQNEGRKTQASDALCGRACQVLVGGVNSPVRAFRSVGGRCVFLEKAEGAYVFDVDGNRYVDLVGSWGPAIVGHAHPLVVEAVSRAAARGLSFGACCEAEVALAERIVGAIASMELIRLVNSGTEAVMSAIRVARAATGRPGVVKFTGCYHGHGDTLLVGAGSGGAAFGVPNSAGVPRELAALTFPAPFNDLVVLGDLLKQHSESIAAIVVEPIAGNMGFVEPLPGFLDGLRTLCDRHGCLLVFDEVMTGFRVAWGGFQNVCGVRPDLTCLGKVIGGGLPVGAYGGRRDLMEQVSPLGPVYQAGTLSGNPVAMAAGSATLELCAAPGFYEELERKGRRLVDGLRDIASANGAALQTGVRGGMFGAAFFDRPVRNFDDAKACDHELYARFFHEMLDRGVWLPPSGYEAMFVSAAHDDAAIAHVLGAAAEAFQRMGT